MESARDCYSAVRTVTSVAPLPLATSRDDISMFAFCAAAVKVAEARVPPVNVTTSASFRWVVPFGRSPVTAAPGAALMPSSVMNVNAYVVATPLFTIWKRWLYFGWVLT